jgi:anti-sigma B factor antagonist
MSTEQKRVPGTVSYNGKPIMSLGLTNHSDVAVITVSGELDLSTAPLLTDLVERVAADHPGRVVIDMANVTFLCAAGLTALLRANETVSAAGRRLILRAPSRQTQRILAITGTDDFFQFDTVVTGRNALG